MDYEERVCFAVTLPPPLSRREQFSVAILLRENAQCLQHPETKLCILERGYSQLVLMMVDAAS